MDFEQILIRLGLDAKALTSGLTRTTSFVKGWATGLMSDLQHHVLGRFAGLYVFEKIFEGIKEKSLFIQRTAKETGLSTNMIQGMANELGYVGEGFEGITKPLGKFNELIGKAKLGSAEARTKLIDLGIVSKGEEINSLNLSKALGAAKVQFDKIGDASIRAARMEEMFGKSWERLMPILELSKKQFADLDRGNFFTKLSPATLETFAELVKGSKAAGNAIVSTVGNFATLLNPIAMVVRASKELSSEHHKSLTWMEKQKYVLLGIVPDLMKESELAKNNAQETTEAAIKRKELTEEVLKLENAIGDRTKLTVHELAARGRAILGDRRPRGLERIHAITPVMASAMRIQGLEDAAQEATARGQFDRATQLQSKADQLRGTNFALKSTERDPTLELRNKLEIINTTLSQAGIIVKQMPTGNH